LLKPDTSDQIHTFGHRDFVGGDGRFWSAVSDLATRYVLDAGLAPHHHFLDIACGALRVGAPLIRHLDAGHYTGVDKHIELVIYGVAEELGLETYREKRPRFLVMDDFRFERLDTSPDYALAQSLFSHMDADGIRLCLGNLRPLAAPGCRFFATFNETEQATANPPRSHSHAFFQYTRAQMESLGEGTNWSPHYVGEWGHPRGQRLIEFRA
jgi:SAM-dependent methyltransferase